MKSAAMNRRRVGIRGKSLGVAVAGLTIVSMLPSVLSNSTASAAKKPITMLVSNYMFDTKQFTAEYDKQIEKEWDAAHPNNPLNVVVIGGSDVNEATALALDFKNASTTPDVIVTETPYLSQYAAAGYMRTLNSDLSGSSAPSFWTEMPKSIQQLTTFGGKVYGVAPGVNDQGILYNKTIFKKAGIPVPWVPKNWADILSAAKKIKATQPGVTPLWLGAGVAAGPFNFAQGIANLIDGTPTPTIFDQKTGKWVVDSPGIEAAFKFYSQVFSDGLGASVSDLFTASAIGTPPLQMRQGKLGITIGANWMPEVWAAPSSGTSYWPTAEADAGVAPLPTEFGQAPGTISELSGWAYGVTSAAPSASLAWDLVKMNMEAQNELDVSIWSGFVPSDPSVAANPQVIKFAPGFNQGFNQYVNGAVSLPTNQNLTVYARAMNTATGDIAQNPKTTVSAAVAAVSSLMEEQLGSGATETKK
jgi:multiple sugar transport system substrate-binding protein